VLTSLGSNNNKLNTLAEYSYDEQGRIKKIMRENGVKTLYSFDEAGQLLGIQHKQAKELIASSEYQLDNAGRRSGQTREDGVSESYSYDATSQLVGVDYGNGLSEQFSYDPLGNRKTSVQTRGVNSDSKRYQANNLNQYASIQGAALSYDLNGNLLDDGQQAYRYDAQNRLIGVQPSERAAASASAVKAEFFYDARNRCILLQVLHQRLTRPVGA
jgi:uncharacterized protein RhaS with RHS repeats